MEGEQIRRAMRMPLPRASCWLTAAVFEVRTRLARQFAPVEQRDGMRARVARRMDNFRHPKRRLVKSDFGTQFHTCYFAHAFGGFFPNANHPARQVPSGA